ncbi:hypothetical protein Ae406Ps2_6262c [Pseudonocardia sp. Ae406_Ps2]|nr:hypothetical protein Ae406Ps2_6262c [Pseudonocardia sp. Ae406_Ps2]OLM09504.1 hypothetical protein Ae706Ps2_6402c [Pseudonocardia sp. Ae706_Ps2]
MGASGLTSGHHPFIGHSAPGSGGLSGEDNAVVNSP